MSRPEAERARGFLQRADADLAAVRAMESLSEVPDEIVGFHGQQAAEKLLKAVLAAHRIDFPRTHSIRFLLDLLDDRGLAPPRTSMASSSSTRSASSSGTKRHSTTSRSTARRCESCSSVFEPGPRPTSCNAASTRRRDPRCCLGGPSE